MFLCIPRRSGYFVCRPMFWRSLFDRPARTIPCPYNFEPLAVLLMRQYGCMFMSHRTNRSLGRLALAAIRVAMAIEIWRFFHRRALRAVVFDQRCHTRTNWMCAYFGSCSCHFVSFRLRWRTYDPSTILDGEEEHFCTIRNILEFQVQNLV
jgi:hypothetical protein